ncbi:MAG TPA: hypothetical protein PLN05_00640 [Pyrinomonadaceae bacterium]|nr:hypothetical protein [Chloracidobacterium sp.]HRJ88806.1 hypothetical protein [Pyrinomonadaceae bacterium]HRK48921.1 hypothetical protein [Pyrinomonadaceae bacterium]
MRSKSLKYPTLVIGILLVGFQTVASQIQVNPTGVNVNSQNPSVVFLTFGQIPAGYAPAEAMWCGQLVPAAPPAIGLQCRPDTIYGVLPTRYNLSQTSGNLGLTDIMSIPSAVVRRAFQTADTGGDAGFFYVRRFTSSLGGPDQFVSVTCRMAGGGARTPFALTDVRYLAETDEPIVFVRRGQPLPVKGVQIRYNGTGRLRGRWELVLPGEELPTNRDLLTEATLPIEDRSGQRRFTQVERFYHFLPPNGEFTLEFKNADKLPLNADGQYLLLLRIEAVDDKEADSNLSVIGVGPGVVNGGAVAGFPMPTFKFFVSGGVSADWAASALITPPVDAELQPTNDPPLFTWRSMNGASFYRIEFFDDNNALRFQALLPASRSVYRAPSWLHSKLSSGAFKWRVISIDDKGSQLSETPFRTALIQR